MDLVHRLAGYAVPAIFLVIAVWGVGLKLARREEDPDAFRALLHWSENLLILQVVVGVILLIIGRRVVVPGEVGWLHYLYGSLFPLIAIVGGRIAGLRRERQEFVGIAWGAFFAFGLTTRALQLGLDSIGG